MAQEFYFLLIRADRLKKVRMLYVLPITVSKTME